MIYLKINYSSGSRSTSFFYRYFSVGGSKDFVIYPELGDEEVHGVNLTNLWHDTKFATKLGIFSTVNHIVTCRAVQATNKTGSSSDDWIY
jgi:hypothetical protein